MLMSRALAVGIEIVRGQKPQAECGICGSRCAARWRQSVGVRCGIHLLALCTAVAPARRAMRTASIAISIALRSCRRMSSTRSRRAAAGRASSTCRAAKRSTGRPTAAAKRSQMRRRGCRVVVAVAGPGARRWLAPGPATRPPCAGAAADAGETRSVRVCRRCECPPFLFVDPRSVLVLAIGSRSSAGTARPFGGRQRVQVAGAPADGR